MGPGNRADRVVASSCRWKTKSPSQGARLGVEREPVTGLHHQEGYGGRETWKLLETLADRGASHSHLTP